jgi:hypothetical protein
MNYSCNSQQLETRYTGSRGVPLDQVLKPIVSASFFAAHLNPAGSVSLLDSSRREQLPAPFSRVSVPFGHFRLQLACAAVPAAISRSHAKLLLLCRVRQSAVIARLLWKLNFHSPCHKKITRMLLIRLQESWETQLLLTHAKNLRGFRCRNR